MRASGCRSADSCCHNLPSSEIILVSHRQLCSPDPLLPSPRSTHLRMRAGGSGDAERGWQPWRRQRKGASEHPLAPICWVCSLRSLRTQIQTNFHIRSRWIMQSYAQGGVRRPRLFDSLSGTLNNCLYSTHPNSCTGHFKGRPVPEQWLVYVSICIRSIRLGDRCLHERKNCHVLI